MSDAQDLARVAAGALSGAGSDVIFGMPGGGNNLEVVGAAEDVGMRFVLTHGEAAAACMAGVYSELTQTPAACVITRGPGAASSVNGVAQAFLDRQSVIVFADTVPSVDASRISHQRLDQNALFAPVTKWSAALSLTDPHYTMKKVLDTAVSPRPGPVHLAFDPSARHETVRPAPVARSGSIAAVKDALAASRHPVVILGVGARQESVGIRAMLEGTNIPVLQTYKAKGVISDTAPNAAGLMTGATIEAGVLEKADTILTIGLDTVELIPGEWPYPAPVFSLSAWPEDSEYFHASTEVVGPISEALAELGPIHDEWDADFAQRHQRRERDAVLSASSAGLGLAPWEVVQRVREVAPQGSIATVDAGAHMLVAMPLWSTQNAGEILISSGLATMGFALPAAIAAALATPGVRVFCFVGDGGLGMMLAELETLARLSLPVTVVVFNDSTLSLIKIKQRSGGQGGDNAVAYRRTDFAAIAKGCGVQAVGVETGDELGRRARESLDAEGPVLLDVLVDPGGYAQVLNAIRGGRN